MDRDLYVANAGDSRCVVCRKGKAIEMSFDHKPDDEPELTRIQRAGGRVNNEGRVNGGLNLSRALGDHAYKTNYDLPLEEQMISSLPDIKTLRIDPETDSFMILACDGIWNSMTSQEVVDFCSERMVAYPEEKLSELANEVSKVCSTEGGKHESDRFEFHQHFRSFFPAVRELSSSKYPWRRHRL